jgi:hypothetical protein
MILESFLDNPANTLRAFTEESRGIFDDGILGVGVLVFLVFLLLLGRAGRSREQKV